MKKHIVLVFVASVFMMTILLLCLLISKQETSVSDYGIAVKGTNGNYIAEIKIDSMSWDKCNDQQKEELIGECISIVEIRNGENEDFILTGVSDVLEDNMVKKNHEVFKYYSKNNIIQIDGKSKDLNF